MTLPIYFFCCNNISGEMLFNEGTTTLAPIRLSCFTAIPTENIFALFNATMPAGAGPEHTLLMTFNIRKNH